MNLIPTRYKRLAMPLWVVAQLSISNPLDPAPSPKISHTPSDDEDHEFKTHVTWSKLRIDALINWTQLQGVMKRH